jgi:NitT/TauT family transport system substrate-binding protein
MNAFAPNQQFVPPQKKKVRTSFIMFIIIVFVALAYVGLRYARNNNLFGLFSDAQKVGITGYAALCSPVFYNNGIGNSKVTNSKYWTELKLDVEFIAFKDPVNEMSSALLAHQIDVAVLTADSYPWMLSKFSDSLICFGQTDWSQGVDRLTVDATINTINDMKGKVGGLLAKTPSMYFGEVVCNSAGFSLKDLGEDNIKYFDTPEQLVAAWESGELNFIFTWSPNDVNLSRKGKVLASSKDAAYALGGIVYTTKEYYQDHLPELVKLMKGWLTANREINTSEQAKQEAATLFDRALQMPDGSTIGDLPDVRLATLGDNLLFMGLTSSSMAITGAKLYEDGIKLYRKIGPIGVLHEELPARLPLWSEVSDQGVIAALRDDKQFAAAPGNEPQRRMPLGKLTAVQEKAIAKADPLGVQFLPIEFGVNSSELSGEAINILDRKIIPILKQWPDMDIVVTGNTDSKGQAEFNRVLSKKRANAIVDYLVSRGFNENRFHPFGDGPDNPVASNDTEEGRQRNRRTDIALKRRS